MKPLIKALCIAGSIMMPLSVWADKKETAQATATRSFNVAKLDSLIAALDANGQNMATLAIAKNGKVIYRKAWGYRQLSDKEQLKADPDTKYRIGSISKMFTATMAFQLIDENKLSLSNHLSDFYPQLPNASKITIEQMLGHRSGLYNFTDSAYISYHTRPKTHEELLAIFATQQPAFEPDAKAEYSNTNYVLLGYIIEKLTGKTYAANLQQRIAGKIGLKNTYFGAGANAAKNEARSFKKDDNGKWIYEDETDMSIPGGAGSIVSTASDLTAFINALFTGRLMSKASLDKMTTIKDGYGKGVFQYPFYDRTAYGHTGGIDEFHSMLSYFPDDSVAVAASLNGMVYGMNDMLLGVLKIYYGKDYTIPSFRTIAIAPEKLTAYEGVYASKQIPLKITVKKEGNRLMAQAAGQGAFPLDAVSETEFKFDPAGIRMVFEKEQDSSIKKFYLKQGGSFLFEKE